jgi:hypothetical protein
LETDRDIATLVCRSFYIYTESEDPLSCFT